MGLSLFAGLVGTAAARAQEPSVKQEPVPDDIWKRMQGSSWHASRKCPARNDLALLTVPYLDFNGQPRTGQMIVAKSVADTVADAFMKIFKSGKFRIEKMNLVDKYSVRNSKGEVTREASDDEATKDNNTSAFNCRFKSGTTELSAHAKGIAIDINRVQNPFVNRSGKVFPKEGSKYDEERSGRRTSWGPSSTETSSRKRSEAEIGRGARIGSAARITSISRQTANWGLAGPLRRLRAPRPLPTAQVFSIRSPPGGVGWTHARRHPLRLPRQGRPRRAGSGRRGRARRLRRRSALDAG